MTNEEYKEYLNSEKWKRIARKRMEIDGKRCVICGSSGTTKNPLEIHHLSYRHLGHEEDRIYEDLVTLCHFHHGEVTRLMGRVTNAQGRRGWSDKTTVPEINVYTLTGQLLVNESK